MGLGGVLVSAGHVESQKIHVERMLLPYAMQQHHHWDLAINRHSQLALFLDGNYRPDVQTEFIKGVVRVQCGERLQTLKVGGKNSERVQMNTLVPLKDEISCGSPGKRVLVFAFHQVDLAGAHHYVQPQRFGVDGDGAKVCVQFVVFHFLATH